jgi:hypothetical protein
VRSLIPTELHTVYVFISGRELHTLRTAAAAAGNTTSQYLSGLSADVRSVR